MIALIDNDVILKIAKWDLLDEMIGILGVDINNIYHLPTCIWVLCPQRNQVKAIEKCGNKETIDRIVMFCQKSKPIPPLDDYKWLEILNNIDGVDVGEVLLFAFGAKTNSLLYIGDKRSISALCQTDYVGKNEIMLLLNNKIKCLEQVIAEMISTYGILLVRNKINSCQTSDKNIKIIFGSVRAATCTNEIVEGLLSSYSSLNYQSGGILAPFPYLPDTT